MNDPLPPPNPSIRWFRVVIWLMPTCIAFATALLFNWLLSNSGLPSYAQFFLWFGVNSACAVGLGLVDRKLSNPTASFNESIPRLAAFLFLQYLIVPIVLVVIVLANFHVD